jgi:hypothetical protein
VSIESLRHLDHLARHYGCRPSALTGEFDTWRAYQLDEACMLAAVLHEEAQTAEEPASPPIAAPQLRTFDGMPLLVGTITKAP